jgi:hypothetical protein
VSWQIDVEIRPVGGPKVLESDESTIVRNPDQNGFALGLME